MKLYDFSIYAERRKEKQAAKMVVEVLEDLNSPGSVVLLKNRVDLWFRLHKEVLKQANL